MKFYVYEHDCPSRMTMISAQTPAQAAEDFLRYCIDRRNGNIVVEPHDAEALAAYTWDETSGTPRMLFRVSARVVATAELVGDFDDEPQR